MAEKKLTIAQKRDRDAAALIAKIQSDYELKIQEMNDEFEETIRKENNAHYSLGLTQGFRDAEAAFLAQSFIDRMLKRTI